MPHRLRLIGVLLATFVACLLIRLPDASGRSYGDDDIRQMKRADERTNRRSRTAAQAVFPIEVMKEPAAAPPVVTRLLPYRDWDDEYRAYFKRHVGEASIDLEPTILVMHFTACETFDAAWNVFTRGANMSAGDRGTIFGHPSVHFMIDRDGTIYQLLPLNRRATGTYGVNHCALQVEMVAVDEADLMNNPALLKASFRLARSLSARFHIDPTHIYGHHQVSQGRSAVPAYRDLADSAYPTSYPPACARTDPGEGYMGWLRYFLRYAPAMR